MSGATKHKKNTRNIIEEVYEDTVSGSNYKNLRHILKTRSNRTDAEILNAMDELDSITEKNSDILYSQLSEIKREILSDLFTNVELAKTLKKYNNELKTMQEMYRNENNEIQGKELDLSDANDLNARMINYETESISQDTLYVQYSKRIYWFLLIMLILLCLFTLYLDGKINHLVYVVMSILFFISYPFFVPDIIIHLYLNTHRYLYPLS